MINSYTFLDQSMVFLKQRNESAANVMMRVLAMPNATISRVRDAVQRLKLELNRRAFELLSHEFSHSFRPRRTKQKRFP